MTAEFDALVPVTLIEHCLRLRNADGTHKVPAEARNIIRAAMDGYVNPPAEPCSTCGGRGSVPWMHESDPNLYQEPDADGHVPCPDCPTSPAKP